jgi:hypothetical protein
MLVLNVIVEGQRMPHCIFFLVDNFEIRCFLFGRRNANLTLREQGTNTETVVTPGILLHNIICFIIIYIPHILCILYSILLYSTGVLGCVSRTLAQVLAVLSSMTPNDYVEHLMTEFSTEFQALSSAAGFATCLHEQDRAMMDRCADAKHQVEGTEWYHASRYDTSCIYIIIYSLFVILSFLGGCLTFRVFGHRRTRAEGHQELRDLYRTVQSMNGKLWRNRRGTDYRVDVSTRSFDVSLQVIHCML